MDFTVTRTDDTEVKVGDKYKSSNQIGINVVAGPQLQAGTKVKVTVSVRCGGKEADLLGSSTESVTVTRLSQANQPLLAVPGPPSGKKGWTTGNILIELPVSISLKSFLSKTLPGETEVEVVVTTSGKAGETHQVKVKKSLEARPNPEIRYFTTEPNYVLHAGQTAVDVSFLATGYESLTLFRNNEEVMSWTGQEGAYPDKPSITSVYRLEGRYTTQTQEKKVDVLDRTVQVISPGWNQIALPQGSPIRLFVVNDFGGRGADRLYGIFKDDNGKSALYSSATGVDAWRSEPGDIPKGMETSPGVYYKNKLWLIGGSSVDPDRPSNDIWCYEADRPTEPRYWKRKGSFDPKMPARMGHACVLFEDSLWVVGGYNNGTAYRDVWQGKENQQGQLEWSPLQSRCAWEGRLNPAAATWKNENGSPEVWIYGGSTQPQSPPMRDFWSSTDGNTWQKLDEKLQPLVPIMPDPGEPLASAFAAFSQVDPSGTARDRLLLMGSFKELAIKAGSPSPGNRVFSFLFEWHPSTGLWEGRPVFDGWEQFQGQNFYMQAVVFNRFMFCWSLRNDPDFMGRLNILVSR
jgi:hypothetical protein